LIATGIYFGLQVVNRRGAHLAVGLGLNPLVERFALPRAPQAGGELRQVGAHGRLIHRCPGLDIYDEAAVLGFHQNRWRGRPDGVENDEPA
jgi:hypothetical protein